MPISEDHPDFVTAFARGLTVIRCFQRGADKLTLTDVAERTGLSRGTARRLLLTLEAVGYITVENNYFRLLPKVLDLGYAYLASIPLWEQAQPFMKSIVDKIDESCSLGVLDVKEVVYIARVPPTHMHTIAVHVGTRLPAYVNAMGRVMLSEMSDEELDRYFQQTELKKFTPNTVTDAAKLRGILRNVRKDGFALVSHEVYEGRASLAVPIRNREGSAIAAINISAMLSRATTADFIEQFLPLLRDAAISIGNAT